MFLHSGTCTKSLAIVTNNTLLLATARISDLSATGLPGPDIVWARQGAHEWSLEAVVTTIAQEQREEM
jgi:hypothetical protein